MIAQVNEYGTVEFYGKTLILMQSPYCDTYFGDGDQRTCFFAHARCETNEYIIRWEITDKETEDASEACDWEDYYVRDLGAY
jgi:hypothetical protein